MIENKDQGTGGRTNTPGQDQPPGEGGGMTSNE
jgi:hypothetical protein